MTALDGFRRSTNNPESISKILKLVTADVYTGTNVPELSQYLRPVTAVTMSDSINFVKLQPILRDLKYEFQEIVPDEVIYVKFSEATSTSMQQTDLISSKESTGTAEKKELIILSNGTVIGWNFGEQQLLEVAPRLSSALDEQYAYESDEFDFIELEQLPPNPKSNGNSYMINDIILIQNVTEEKKILDKVAFSIGMSRSTRVSILEDNLEQFLKITRRNSDRLSKGLPVTASEHDVLQLTGKLFLLRGKLNLYNELIDTPDLYWSEPTLEKIYQQISTSLDINWRISILNRKLDYATDEQRAFLSFLNERKGTRLEWTIIILILIEVGFETYRFWQDTRPGSSSE
ncbi:hypothetical protein PSN45_001989 [Yamadazyma tenuis]|nr:hypothetical protein PSN45_001989 [Yamadazyma tenuis]